jgi:hypothetical protein
MLVLMCREVAPEHHFGIDTSVGWVRCSRNPEDAYISPTFNALRYGNASSEILSTAVTTLRFARLGVDAFLVDCK